MHIKAKIFNKTSGKNYSSAKRKDSSWEYENSTTKY